MRILLLPFALLASPTFAEDILLSSRVSAVTLYPQGATVERQVSYNAPAGQHRLIVADLPQGTPLAAVRVAVSGAQTGSVTTRNDYVPPRDETEGPALASARAEVERLEDALREARAGVEDIRLEAQAASARITFLEQLGQGDGMAALGIDQLKDLATMVGEETLAARRDLVDAGRRADAAERALKDQIEALERARTALAALVPEDKARAMVAVGIRSDVPATGTITITYTIDDAGWQPLYDLHLARETGELRIERGAFVEQMTGENWQDVALSLSTLRPSDQTEPNKLWPWIPRIEDPNVILPMARGKAEEAMISSAPASADAPVPEVATARFDGLSVTYNYPSPVSITSGADRVRLMFDTQKTRAQVVAKAVPMLDQTAYLVARLTNDTGEPLLSTPEARFYVDDRYAGMRWLEPMANGEKAELSFGPIEGLRLTRRVITRNEGDRGIITKSNEMSESAEIIVENLTDEAWPVRLIDRVPVSEQEDLKITWKADPVPSENDVESERGILAWEFTLPAKERMMISLSTRLTWPEGKSLN